MINNITPAKPYHFSPWQKTSHFLLLLVLIDLILIAIIIYIAFILAKTCDTESIDLLSGLGNCNPREVLNPTIYRISALLNINVIFLLLYSGFISYVYNRRVASLIIFAFIIFFITSFFRIIDYFIL